MRGETPLETRRGFPGDTADVQSRDIEAVIGGIVVGCLYAPNGNPAPGPKLDYKLRWFERFGSYATNLLDLELPVSIGVDRDVGGWLHASDPAPVWLTLR